MIALSLVVLPEITSAPAPLFSIEHVRIVSPEWVISRETMAVDPGNVIFVEGAHEFVLTKADMALLHGEDVAMLTRLETPLGHADITDVPIED